MSLVGSLTLKRKRRHTTYMRQQSGSIALRVSLTATTLALTRGLKKRIGTVAAFVALVAVVQIVILICFSGQLSTVTKGVEKVLVLLSQDEHPSLAAAIDVLREFISNLVVVVGASALGWVAAAITAAIWLRRHAKQQFPKLSLLTRANIAVHWILALLLAFLLALVVVSPMVVVNLANVRGSTIATAVPNSLLIGMVLIMLGIAIVVCTIATLQPEWLNVETELENVSPSSTIGSVETATSQSHTSQSSQLVLSVGGGILLALTLPLIISARPISDDLRVLALARDQNLAEFMLKHNGRYSQGLWYWFVGHPFGVYATQVTGIVIVLLLWGACVMALRTWVRPQWTWPRIVGIGGMITGAAVWSVPSFVDSFTWFTSACAHTSGVAGLVFSAVFVWRLWKDEHIRWTSVIGSLILVGLTCGFNEGVTVIVVLSAGTLALVALVHRRRRIAFLSVFAVSAIGLSMMLFAPVQVARAEAANMSSVLVALAGSAYSCLHLVTSLSVSEWLILVGTGIGVGICLGTTLSLKHRIRLALTGATLVAIPPFLFGAVTFYGLAWASWRTYTPQSILWAWGVIMLLASLTSCVGHVLRNQNILRRTLSTAMATFLLFGVIFQVFEFERLSTALSLRSSLVSSRDANVISQLSHGNSSITITPAPLLYYPTDTRDFEFLKEQNKDWFFPGYRNWYYIPSSATLIYETQQPAGYCVNDSSILLPNVSQCDDLPK